MEDPDRKKRTFIEGYLDLMGITDEEERKQRIEEHEAGVEKLRNIMEKRFEFLRPFIKKLQIFTENDIYQYIKKEKDNPDWVKFKSVKRCLHRLFMDGELEIDFIYQEDPRPNTIIYFIPDINKDLKNDYINCVIDCNKLKTNCHDDLFKENSRES